MSQNTAKPQLITNAPAGLLSERPIIVERDGLLNRMKEVSETIAKRAYEFFETRGREFGRDIDDWVHAELELIRPVPIDITESEVELKIRAEVPGFTAKDIQVSIEPNRLIISGKIEKAEERETEKTVHTECLSNEIFRALDLPAEVDPAKVTATLKDGVLQLSLAKAPIGEPVKVDVQAS